MGLTGKLTRYGQAEPWEREASEHLAGGLVAPAVDAYQQAGRLHVVDTRDAARDELLAQHAADRKVDPAHGQLVLAYRNEDVARLNSALRSRFQRGTVERPAPGLARPVAVTASDDAFPLLGAAQRRLGDPGLAPLPAATTLEAR